MHPLRKHIEQVVSLTDEEFEVILTTCRKRVLKKNQYLLLEGNQCTSDFFVLSGSLRQYYTDDKGKEHIVQFAVQNWWISDWDSILHQKPSFYNIDALEASEVLQFGYQQLEHLFEEVPKMERYFRIMLQRGFAAHQSRILWLQKPAKARYLEFISAYPHFEQRLSQSHIASFLGITRESLSRLKAKN
ncbi:MAG: Crp/Fnr family transcriptional regulator [Dyadobacter sp.]|uniref:Crp/Fnr family transcriptional regulator n=1 Tax=Dyadobacter sp. TaxID=1914288 RepID=UPI0032670607